VRQPAPAIGARVVLTDEARGGVGPIAGSERRVLVTGGAGFIGSEVARLLVNAGNLVLVVDNLVNGRPENLDGVQSDRCRLAVADIRDEGQMGKLLTGIDTVFHLACLGVRHSIHSPRENHEVNATATLGLLSAARAAGVSRFVYVSSSEVYGTAVRVPMGEDHPTQPHTVYGASKLAGECYTRAYQRTYGLATTVVRPFNTFGPRCHHEGDSGEVIPRFMLRAMAGRPLVVFGDGAQTRDFTYVTDTARGILLAGSSDATVGETLNLGTGREVAISDLARAVLEVVAGSRSSVVHEPPRPGDVGRLCADSAKARSLLGFEAPTTLREGLERLLEWYRGRRRSAEELLEEEVVHNWKSTGRPRND
jgi:UDP-glucose 4-epimerase